jgi:glutamate dehydrogenase
LDYQVSADEQYALIFSFSRRIRRATHWFIANRRRGLDVGHEVKQFKKALAEVHHCASDLLKEGAAKSKREQKIAHYQDLGLDPRWYELLTMPDNLYSGLAIVEVALTTSKSIKRCTEVFFELLDSLSLSDFATQLSGIDVSNFWQANAREGYISELEAQIRKLSVLVLESSDESLSTDKMVELWSEQNAVAVERWKNVVKQVQSTAEHDYAMFAVATKELSDLVEFASLSGD